MVLRLICRDTALLIASNEGYPEVARLLLKSCAQVDILDNIGRSALMLKGIKSIDRKWGKDRFSVE